MLRIILPENLKGAAITTLSERYEQIRDRRSFSFQTKKRASLRHGIKVFFLVLAVTALGWYGQQTANNPLSPVYTIMVGCNGNNATFLYTEKSLRKNYTLAILPTDTMCCLGKTPLFVSRKWDLVSSTRAVRIDSLLISPPCSWYIMDTLPQIPRTDLPVPALLSGKCTSPCAVKKTFPFNDDRSAVCIIIGNTRVLFIDATLMRTAPDETTSLREQVDLLVVTNADSESVVRLRMQLRPRYTIGYGDFAVKPPEFKNLLVAPTTTALFFTFKTRKSGGTVTYEPMPENG